MISRGRQDSDRFRKESPTRHILTLPNPICYIYYTPDQDCLSRLPSGQRIVLVLCSDYPAEDEDARLLVRSEGRGSAHVLILRKQEQEILLIWRSRPRRSFSVETSTLNDPNKPYGWTRPAKIPQIISQDEIRDLDGILIYDNDNDNDNEKRWTVEQQDSGSWKGLKEVRRNHIVRAAIGIVSRDILRAILMVCRISRRTMTLLCSMSEQTASEWQNPSYTVKA